MKLVSRATWLLFLSYTLLMIYLLFFGFSRATRTERLYNLTPFKTIWNYIADIQYYNLDIWIINLFGNVAAFVPFGFLIPVLFRSYTKWYKLMNLLFWALLLVESIQFIFKVGSFDVDDIILNVIGGLVGYTAYVLTIGRKMRCRNLP
ncbi:VanZ family protein [Paenibacillus sp. UNC451MF]|uniref:VanZ family protein n=1 Tax=Paenibacillus sp. UNC451MF TaxID=1449063 RepID=UPI0018CC1C31|nr:VanZ family protein [Paenibacillus sp. UNC451MF]